MLTKGPRVAVGNLAAQPVDLVVVAVHRHQGGVINGRSDDLALLQVRWDEDHSLNPSAGGMGCHRAG